MRLNAPADAFIASELTGAELFSDVMMPCAPAHSAEPGDTSEIAHVGYAVEHHDERCFVVRYAVENILHADIFYCCDLRDHTLMIALCQSVEFLDRHLLNAQAVADAQIAQVVHQLTVRTLADVYLLYLFPRLDCFGDGTYSEY